MRQLKFWRVLVFLGIGFYGAYRRQGSAGCGQWWYWPCIYCIPKIISSWVRVLTYLVYCSSPHCLWRVFLPWSVFWKCQLRHAGQVKKWGRTKAVTIIGGAVRWFSVILFSSVNAIKLVDIVDHFINNIGIIGGAVDFNYQYCVV